MMPMAFATYLFPCSSLEVVDTSLETIKQLADFLDNPSAIPVGRSQIQDAQAEEQNPQENLHAEGSGNVNIPFEIIQ